MSKSEKIKLWQEFMNKNQPLYVSMRLAENIEDIEIRFYNKKTRKLLLFILPESVFEEQEFVVI